MKKLIILLIAATILLLSACEVQQPSSELQSSETISSESEFVSNVSEKEAVSSESTVLTKDEIQETTAETTETNALKLKESIFVNFEDIELKGTADIGSLADKAVEFIKTTDEYILSMADIFALQGGEFDDYISNGKIVPKIIGAYPDDYDGDGKTETFIILELPRVNDYTYEYTHKYFIFADSSENMTLLDNIPENVPVHMLDYGKVKQIIFGGFSPFAYAEEHYAIYGVKNDQAVLLCNSQMYYKKEKCFLLAPDKWGISAMMYFDSETGNYTTVVGKEIPVSEIQKMDTAGNIENKYDECFLVGNKFYVMYASSFVSGTYIYENKKFVRADFWLRTNWDNDDSKEVDYDEAISNMADL